MAQRRILLVGASRGVGLGLARRFAQEGWEVTATARAAGGALAQVPDVRTELVDIAVPSQVAALHERLEGSRFDVVFVVAGVGGDRARAAPDVPAEDAAQVLLTNAHAPLVLAERLLDRLVPGGTVAFMSSRMGSIGSNDQGGMELYRASKAALNMLARCFALRHAELTVLLLHPGWVRTDMGGPDADLDVQTSAAGLVAQVTAHMGQGGCAFLDWKGDALPW